MTSGVLGSINTIFRKLDMFPSSGEGEEKTSTELGPLERANLNHWTKVYLVVHYEKPKSVTFSCAQQLTNTTKQNFRTFIYILQHNQKHSIQNSMHTT
jgi:hypothetical protein